MGADKNTLNQVMKLGIRHPRMKERTFSGQEPKPPPIFFPLALGLAAGPGDAQ
jgi:hypothetical protein